MARTSRKAAAANQAKPAARIWRVAVYARLSEEDSGRRGSDTIDNQVALIEGFIRQRPDLRVVSTFIDNGRTGTNFERPQFGRMLDAIRAGEIDCVTVKDSSRFGRNYIETLEYLEKIFPFFGVRFISINDAYDSENTNGSDELILMLKSLMDDAYARDISRKILSSVEARREKGLRTGLPPYGYKQIRSEKGRMEPDSETAPVVLDIFRQRAEGATYAEIARRFNERGVPCPSARKGGKQYANTIIKCW